MRHHLSAAVIAALVAGGVAFFMPRQATPPEHAQAIAQQQPHQTATHETAYERVIRTNTLRCGYVAWPPYIVKDPNTGIMSGLSYDLISALGKQLELQIEWTEEVNWGTYQAGLDTGRYDMMCVGVWQSGPRAKAALLSHAAYYDSMFAYAREDDARFDASFESANAPDVTIAVLDNDTTQTLRKTLFPLAQEMPLSQMNDSSQFMLSVATHKADIAFANALAVEAYNRAATVKLKAIAGGKPVRHFGNFYPLKRGEFELKALIDSGIEALSTSGEDATIIAHYGAEAGFLPIATGYTR